MPKPNAQRRVSQWEMSSPHEAPLDGVKSRPPRPLQDVLPSLLLPGHDGDGRGGDRHHHGHGVVVLGPPRGLHAAAGAGPAHLRPHGASLPFVLAFAGLLVLGEHAELEEAPLPFALPLARALLVRHHPPLAHHGPPLPLPLPLPGLLLLRQARALGRRLEVDADAAGRDATLAQVHQVSRQGSSPKTTPYTSPALGVLATVGVQVAVM